MEIVEPSAHIIEKDLEQLSIYQRIAYCAGVCYQREPRKTEEEAQAFCKRMVEIGHMSTLEMGVVHLVQDWHDKPESNFVMLSPGQYNNTIVSGSIRAFLEAEDEYGSRVWNFLADQYPVFFSESDIPGNSVRFADPHEIPWQHKHVAVRFIVNRAISHELVRHRPMSWLQESQRYCRYDDEVTFIRPEWWINDNINIVATSENDFAQHMSACESRYRVFLKRGFKPQQARAVLPNSTKTELIGYASLPQWKHIFKLRCSPAADPEMRRVMIPLREEFQEQYPEMWEGKEARA